MFIFVLYRLKPRIQSLDGLRLSLLSLGASVANVHALLDPTDKPYIRSGTVPHAGIEGRSVRGHPVPVRTRRPAPRRGHVHDPGRSDDGVRRAVGGGKVDRGEAPVPPLRPGRRYDHRRRPAASDLDLADWRARAAFVSQDVYLFDGTVRDNIAYGREGASDTEIRAAARAAHADGFIERLPEGYDTPVGDRGVRLSGGQRQRIALARAVVRDPDLLLLDEATNALDTRTEHVVQEALESFSRGRTTVVIAHRLSTVEQADHIVVLDGGRVAEQGTPTELIDRDGLFAELYRLQYRSACPEPARAVPPPRPRPRPPAPRRLAGGDEDGVAVLVRRVGRPVAFWMEPRPAGAEVSAEDLAARAATEVARTCPAGRGVGGGHGAPATPPPVTIAVCTHGRPERLARCLRSLGALRTPAGAQPPDVLVVDNAPPDDRSKEVVEAPGVRYVREPLVGLDFARNRALAEARATGSRSSTTTSWPTPGGTRGSRGARRPPRRRGRDRARAPAALATEAQILFERAGGFRRGFRPHRYRGSTMADTPSTRRARGSSGPARTWRSGGARSSTSAGSTRRSTPARRSPAGGTSTSSTASSARASRSCTGRPPSSSTSTAANSTRYAGSTTVGGRGSWRS